MARLGYFSQFEENDRDGHVTLTRNAACSVDDLFEVHINKRYGANMDFHCMQTSYNHVYGIN